MKAAFVHGPHDLRLDDIARPSPGPQDVVIEVATVGVCGSDVGYVALGGITGPADAPMPLGHELSGIISEIGNEVADVHVGQRVVLNPYANAIGNGGPEGGFAAYLLVRDVVKQPNLLIPMPDDMSFDVGALIEPLAVATHAVNRMELKRGDTIAIFGAGPIGLGAIITLRARGFDKIVVIEPSAFRRDRAVQLGAQIAIDPHSGDVSAALIEAHGAMTIWGGFQAPATTHFLEASGAPSVIPGIIALAGFGARLVMVSVQKVAVLTDFTTVLAKELTIAAAMGYPNEFDEVFDLLRKQRPNLEPIVSHRFASEAFLEAFQTAKRSDEAAKVLVQYRH
jgi:2-desacetyl-2-hydroxyethyl bacteriochlorophyllide A dehydrogenase